MSQTDSTKHSRQSQVRDDLIEIDLSAIVFALRKRRGFIFFTTAFFTALAAGYCFLVPPVYRATATLLIENEQNNIIQIEELYGLDSSDQDYFQTQFEMLKSRDLAKKVVEKLNLVDNQEFNSQLSLVEDKLLPLIQSLPALIKSASADDHLVRDVQWRLFVLGEFPYKISGELTEFTQQSIDSFMVSRNKATQAANLNAVLHELDLAVAENDSLKQTAAAPTTQTVAAPAAQTTLAKIESAAVIETPADSPAKPVAHAAFTPSTELELLQQMEANSYSEEQLNTLDLLVGGLDIQPVRKTKLINISFESQSPRMAAFIPNAVGKIYIEDYLQGKDEATDKASEWLVDRLEKLEVLLRESEEKLRDYKKTNKLVDIGGGVTRYNEQELLSLSAKLLDARRELAASKALYDEVERLEILAPEELENLLAVQSSTIVRTYKVERSEVEREIDELANKYGDKHPRMHDAQSRLSVITRNIELEVDRVVSSITNDYQLNRSNVRSLSSAVNSGKREIEKIGEKGFELAQLQREVDANRNLYETFFNRYRETDEARSLETTNARVSNIAEIPVHALKPNKKLILAIAFIGSLIGACMIALMRESFDGSIDTMGGIEKIERKLGVPLVGIIPKLKAQFKQQNKDHPVYPPDTAQDGGPFTEAVRTICSSITLSKKGKNNKVIVITSSVPDEGKSTASVNIAYELAMSEKTLLIDADFRKPSVHKIFKYASSPDGMTHVLEDPSRLKDAIQKNVIGQLDVLFAGKKTDSPTALLTSKNLATIINVFKDKYDRIVIDTPPVHAVSDMLYLAQYTDSVIYVVRSESTDLKLVERGLEKLRQVEAPLHGICIAQVDIEKMKRYGSRYYSGYYDYYGYS